MSATNRRTRRCFIEAAEAAALAKRREDAMKPWDTMTLEVFVVRVAPASKAYTWEVRRFDGVVLCRGEMGLPSMRKAHSAGILALAALAVS